MSAGCRNFAPRDALSRSLLEERTDAFEKETAEWEDRQKALEELFEQLKGEEDLEVSALKGDKAGLLVKASIEEADERQSREPTMINAVFDAEATRVSFKNLKRDQHRILNEAEDLAIKRAEQARSVLQLTSIGSDRIMSTAEMGGPVVSMANFASTANSGPATEESTFYMRLAQTQARVTEMRYYEQIVKNLPLSDPVGVPYRLTSDYGMRVDPFTKRPGWHNGLDFAAYRNAPIVAAGPGESHMPVHGQDMDDW